MQSKKYNVSTFLASTDHQTSKDEQALPTFRFKLYLQKKVQTYAKKDEMLKGQVSDSGNKGSQASSAGRREREHHLGGEFREETDSSISARFGVRSYALGSPRGSSSVTSRTAWGPYASVTPVATTPKGSHGASYARPGERETEAEGSGKIKKDGVGKGNRENISRETTGDGREEEKGRNIRGRPKGQRSGEPASSRCIEARKSGALRRRSLSLLHDATYYSNRNAGPQGSSARGRQREESMASKGGGGGQGRADSRGRETFQSLVASLPGWLPAYLLACLLACLFVRLSARRLPSHRPKASPRYVECHTHTHTQIIVTIVQNHLTGYQDRSIFISS